MNTTVLAEPQTLRRFSLSPAYPEMSDAKERFPSLEISRSNEIHKSPEEYAPVNFSQWQPRQRQDFGRHGTNPFKHRTRKSVSEALGNFTARRGSVSANAQELAESLKAPVSWKLIMLCITWYMSSALTNTSTKSILNTFPKPITLTLIQFAFVSAWCLIFAWLATIFPGMRRTVPALKQGLRYPSPDVLLTALPLSVFQLLGHILSATATERIPVSLVHTIKGLSPLFTVAAYRVFFRLRYARATYLSLLPLTAGVMLACSADISTNFVGISCAFIATVVFVAQNIFSKKLFNDAARAESGGDHRKLDKLNLLCYCSGGAFILTAPVWLLSEGFALLADLWDDGSINLVTHSRNHKPLLTPSALIIEFIFNGVFHFGQNILAFILLSMLSPVSYSVASLIKRVWVVVIAIFWFGSSTTGAQAVGILLTFVGLYLYDRTSMDDAAERRAKADRFHNAQKAPTLLPLTEESRPNSSHGNHNHHLSNGHGITPNGPSIHNQPANWKFEFPSRNNRDDDHDRTENSADNDGNGGAGGGGYVGQSIMQQQTTQQRGPASSFSNKNRDLLPGAKMESTWEPGDEREDARNKPSPST